MRKILCIMLSFFAVMLCVSCAFADYYNGKVDFDKAKANFETRVMERYPEITEVEWP